MQSASDEKRPNEEGLSFEEFHALAECGNDLFEYAHVVELMLVGNHGAGTLGVGGVSR